MIQLQKITFKTSDGVLIHGLWNESRNGAPAVLLLHMMPETKESWTKFQEKLNEAGYSSLAIDLRGHGESTQKLKVKSEKLKVNDDFEILNYKKFSDAQHQEKRLDALAAAAWLRSGGADAEKIIVVGASIGANLALQYGAEHPDTPALIALSPGLNYRGINTVPLVKALSREQSLFLAASEDDAESAHAVRKLEEISLAKTKVKIFSQAGHGTRIFEQEPEFMEELAQWIKETINK